MIQIEIDDREVRQALHRLAERGTRLGPAMRDIGELLMQSTKQRFVEGRGPDGEVWPRNTEATLLAHLRRRGGGTSRRKGENFGRLTKRGADTIRGKRPLIGESKRLSTEIHYQATGSSVEVGSNMEYAAVQQFGAKKGVFGRSRRGPIPWGDIPARPFLGLSAEDRDGVLDILQEHFEGVLRA